jgi:hypothetical protein
MFALSAAVQITKKKRGYCYTFNVVIKSNVCSVRDDAHIAQKAWMPPRYMYQLFFIF